LSTEINFFTEKIDFSLDNESNIKSWIKKSIEDENCISGDLNFIFTSDQNLLQINKDFLNHDFFTDIITFDYRESDSISGDIFLSIDRIKENAKGLSNSFNNELHRVLIHGVLHIIGYNDRSAEEELLMRSKEDFYLSLRTF